MHSDIVDLRSFYSTTLGRFAERSIAMALSSIWAAVPNERLVGLGYTLPWLERFGTNAERVFAFMPATQGAVVWPATGPTATALVFDEELPLVDSCIDRMLLVHSLEHVENPRETLNEIWRVLSPAGRIVIVVPNRRGVWARFEHTPFGNGRPFSRGQLTELLREANFTPASWSDALFFPPSRRRFMMRFHNVLERAGRRLWPIFSGVIVVEAQKRLYQGVPVAQRASRRVFVPVLSPQGATRLGRLTEAGSTTTATRQVTPFDHGQNWRDHGENWCCVAFSSLSVASAFQVRLNDGCLQVSPSGFSAAVERKDPGHG